MKQINIRADSMGQGNRMRDTMTDHTSLKLLVVTMLYEPDRVGIAAVASDMCEALAARGHDITVYTTYPYYPEWKLKCSANPWRIQEESIAQVKVRRHGLFIPSHPSRLLPRVMHELSFPISLMRSLFRRERYDAVVVFCPLLGSVVFAAVRKLFFREPLWVDIQDLPAEAGLASGINRSRILHRIVGLVQKYLFRCGEVWSSISPEMVAQVETLKAKGTTVHLVPNWLIDSLAEHVQRLPSKIGRQPQGRCKLLYCGTIGNKQGLREFCQQLQATCHGNFHFQIHGEGSEARAVKTWIEQSGDQRFEFGGLLPDAEFIRKIHDADWFVISEKPGAGFSFLPSKLIPCISAGTPVIAISDHSSPLGHEVATQGLGIAIEWARLDQLPRELAEYRRSPEKFTLLQQNCLHRASAFDREAAIDRVEQVLLEFVVCRDGKTDELEERCRTC